MRRLLNMFFNPSGPEEGTLAEGLVLYHFASCPYCVRVRLAARRMGLRLEERNIHRDAAARDELLRGGGKTQVPCLRIEGTGDEAPRWLYESGDIVQFLEARFR